MAPLERWNDDRLDDLRTMVNNNDTRIDRLDDLTDAHDHALRDIATAGDRRRASRDRLETLLIATIVTQLATVLTFLIETHLH